jgi:hypothetical protein
MMAAMLQRVQYRLRAAPRSVAMPAAMSCMKLAATLVSQVVLAVPVLARLDRELAGHVAIDLVAPAVVSWMSA